MGEVIKPTFGKPRTVAEPESTRTSRSRPNLLAELGALGEVARELGVEMFWFDVVEPMRQHLNTQQGRVSSFVINGHLPALRKLTDDQIRELGKNSTEHGWSTKPGYYWALLTVIDERKLT